MKTSFNSRHFLLAVLVLSFAVLLAGRYFETSIGKTHIDLAFTITGFAIILVVYFFIQEINRAARVHARLVVREEFLRETLNSVEEGVISTDKEGIIQGMNPSAEKLTGWLNSEAMGHPLESVYNVVNEETGKSFDHIVTRILREGKSVEFENNTILRKRNAQEIIISNNGSPIRDHAGNIVGSVLVFRDITEIKKAAEETQMLTNRLLLATQSAELGIWEWDIVNDHLTWDERMHSIYNTAGSGFESVYESWRLRLHPEDSERVQAEIQSALYGGNEYNTEFRIIVAKSIIRYVKATGVVERNREGEPVRMTGMNWDITESKDAEERLRQSEMFNRGVLNSLNSQIAVVDHHGVIVAVSKSWKRFAMDNSDTNLKNKMVGADYFQVCRRAAEAGDLIAEQSLNGILSVLHEKQADFYMEYPCNSPDEERWFSMHVTRFNNNTSMLVIEHQDITPRKSAESERERITSDLIRRNEKMEQFSHVVSHNLRAPLANILGLGELLKYQNSSPDYLTNLVRGMSDAAAKLDEVVKELNEILQLKTPRPEEKEPVRFDDIVKDISAGLDSLIKGRNVTIQTDFQNAELIFSVKKAIRSIFYNLIHSSINYHKPGFNIQIELSSSRTPYGLELIMKDNDLEKKEEKPLGMYRQLPINTAGKGMKLFMIKTQVETLGGTFTVSARENKGTEYIIKFENPNE